MLTRARGNTSRSGVPLWPNRVAPYRGRFHVGPLPATSRGKVEVLRPREERFDNYRLLQKGQPLQPPPNGGYGAASGRPEVRAHPRREEGSFPWGASCGIRPSLWGAISGLLPLRGGVNGRDHVWGDVSLQRRQSPKVAERQVKAGRQLLSSHIREEKEH